MSESDGKENHPERLNEHMQSVEYWFQQTIEDMHRKSVFAPLKRVCVIDAHAATTKHWKREGLRHLLLWISWA
jgi:hypothetical protein